MIPADVVEGSLGKQAGILKGNIQLSIKSNGKGVFTFDSFHKFGIGPKIFSKINTKINPDRSNPETLLASYDNLLYKSHASDELYSNENHYLKECRF